MIKIVTGSIAPPSVSVAKVLEIGQFENKLPHGYYDTITKQVEIMSVMKKSIQV